MAMIDPVTAKAKCRPVLLGGRCAPRKRSEFGHGIFVWLPVAVMLLVIVRESTATFGSTNTSHWFRPAWEALFGHLTDERWDEVHHYIRKTGHFLGYGTLGLAWLRAFLLSWMWSFRQQSAATWRRWSVQMALCCTALVASLDEVHQSYIPDRTGLVTDVLLDTCGATVLCMICVVLWRRTGLRVPAFQSA